MFEDMHMQTFRWIHVCEHILCIYICIQDIIFWEQDMSPCFGHCRISRKVATKCTHIKEMVVHMYMCKFMYIYIYMHAYVYIYIYICTYMYSCAYKYWCVYIYVHTCMNSYTRKIHVFIYVYIKYTYKLYIYVIHIYIHIFIYIYICIQWTLYIVAWPCIVCSRFSKNQKNQARL